MKKILLGLLLSLFIATGMHSQALSATSTQTTIQGSAVVNWDSAANLKRVNAVGGNILAKNALPNKIIFKVLEDETVNAYANINQEIYIQKGLLQFVENDDELAAVISHEIGHIINAHIQRQGLISALVSYFSSKVTNEKLSTGVSTATQLSMLKLSRNDEYESDLTGVDLMLKAGYNPLAMISVLNKICANYMDIIATHPSGDKRTMNVYDYVSYNYPLALKAPVKTDSYSSFVLYAQPTAELRKTNPKAMEKFNKKQAKLKEKRIKRAQKLRSTNPWAATYSTLKVLSGS